MRMHAINLLAAVAMFGLLGAAVYQRGQVRALRGNEKALAAEAQSVSAPSAEEFRTAPAPSDQAPPAELLQLRNEATRLSARYRELVAAQAENVRLRESVAARGTNSLPPGYVRKADARFLGYDTPEHTLQSTLWAVQNRDTHRLLAGLTPDAAGQFEAIMGDQAQLDRFFKEMQMFVGYRVLKSQREPTKGTASMEIEVIPGVPSGTLHFQLTNGQWRVSLPR